MNKIFKFRFSGSFGQVFATFFENLTENLTIHKYKNFVHMILNTRDHKDSSNIFRFFVSHHKKIVYFFVGRPNLKKKENDPRVLKIGTQQP